MITIQADGSNLGTWTVSGTSGITNLSARLPKPETIAQLKILVGAGGEKPWYFEHAFIGKIWFSEK